MSLGSDKKDIYTIRDVTHDFCVTIHEKGHVYLIGLGTDGNIKAVQTERSSAEGICVSLLQLNISENGGMVLGPINLDLCCTINGEDLAGEINLLSGVPIEIADRTIRIYKGGVPSRKLPATPGIMVNSSPPPKPRRDGQDGQDGDGDTDSVIGDLEIINVPVIDPELLSNLNSSGQLANLAASFLTKQINQYTDTKLSSAITDQIFSFLQEVAGYQRAIIVAYITEISQSLEEMPEAERDRPLHKPAVRLLVELLRQIMDPLSHVVLSLQLLRTFSHFPQNLVVMVHCQATPAVLGCMAVYLDVTEIQQYGLDILARIATYKPQLQEKIPLRETALEMILRSVNHHQKNVHIVPPGCRTLVNLTSTLQENLDTFLLTEYMSCPEIEEEIERYESLLRHIFEQAIPIIQAILQEYPNNLDVKTEGRRFLFNYSKMTQIMQRKKIRALPRSQDDSDVFVETLTTPKTFVSSKREAEPPSILKKTADKDYMSTLDRKVHFADDREPLESMTSSDGEDDSEVDMSSSVDSGPRLIVKETIVLGEADIAELRKNSPMYESGDYMDMENSEVSSPVQSGSVTSDSKMEDSAVKSPSQSEGEVNNAKAETCPSEETVNMTDMREDTSGAMVTESCSSTLVSDSNSHDGQQELKDCKSDNDSVHLELLTESNISTDQEGEGSKLECADEKLVGVEQNSTLDEGEDYTVMDFTEDGGNVSTNKQDLQEKDDPVQKRVSSGTRQSEHLRYSVSDVSLCTKVIRLKVCHHISCLVFRGQDAIALSIIDKPVSILLGESQAPEGLISYATSQYEENKTLMDIDTAFLISVIDAVRYRSLFHDLLQKCVTEVMSCLFGKYSADVVVVALECLIQAFQDNQTSSLLSDKSFVEESKGTVSKLTAVMQAELPEFVQLTKLISELQPLE